MTPDGTPAERATCRACTPADGIMVGCELGAGHEGKHHGTYVHEFAGVAVDVEVSWMPDDPAAAFHDGEARR